MQAIVGQMQQNAAAQSTSLVGACMQELANANARPWQPVHPPPPSLAETQAAQAAARAAQVPRAARTAPPWAVGNTPAAASSGPAPATRTSPGDHHPEWWGTVPATQPAVPASRIPGTTVLIPPPGPAPATMPPAPVPTAAPSNGPAPGPPPAGSTGQPPMKEHWGEHTCMCDAIVNEVTHDVWNTHTHIVLHIS